MLDKIKQRIVKHSKLIIRFVALGIAAYEIYLVYTLIVAPIFFPPPVESAAITARQTKLNTALQNDVIEAMDAKERQEIIYTEVRDPFMLRK